MGCDIHIVFETRNAGIWRPTFPAMLRPDEWCESIIDHYADDLRGLGIDDPYEGLETHFASLDPNDSTVLAEYLSHPRLRLEFDLPHHPNDLTGSNYRHSVIRSRDYKWFSRLCDGGRGNGPIKRPARGVPDDISVECRNVIRHWDGDGHSHSWLTVDEMLASPDLQECSQNKWLASRIPDPINTRMVFFFDN